MSYLTTLQFLLRGHPSELLPHERQFFIDQAYRAMTHPSLDDLQRARIRSVWIDGKYRPPLSQRITQRVEATP